MVNVPPIPPLLCSTPPPIDFGEDDADIDVIPPTLNGVEDDDFGDFLTVDDTKNSEPLPSPRPPSVCDLPPVSIYDVLIPPDEEDIKNRETTETAPTSIDDKATLSRDSRSTTKPINVTEAYNYNVKNICNGTRIIDNEGNKSSLDVNPIVRANESTQAENVFKAQSQLEAESNLLETNNKLKGGEEINVTSSTSLSKNVNALTIETSCEENKYNSNDSNISCEKNVVYIEDLEDDLSDDELYSPKTPKNFTETDNIKDYFTIQEIKTESNQEQESKFDSNDVDTKSFDSLDNNESTSLGNDNDNDYKSFSSDSFPQHQFDVPPPLEDGDDDKKSIDDDFGDFANFQDFNTTTETTRETQNLVNNAVPVSDINIIKNIKQNNKNDLELNSFNDFINYNNTTKESSDINNDKNKNETNEFKGFKDSTEDDDEFDDFTSHTDTSAVKFDVKYSDLENSKQNSIEVDKITQEIANKHCQEINKSTVKDFNEMQPVGEVIGETVSPEETTSIDNSFGDFNAASETTDNNFGNFAEFSKNQNGLNNEITFATESSKKPTENSHDMLNDDEFDDFADFESHQEISIPEIKISDRAISKNEKSMFTSNYANNLEGVDDDDDDFGDFNTAQPISATASNITTSTTSQNTSTSTTITPTQPPHNLNERISKILQLMFTPILTDTGENCDKPKANKIQDIPFTSIDAAKALEYQWLNSDTRHAFIKSLGIDSRNILFGDNWNPSLPRFAANLSFNPLKPMKPVEHSSNTINDSNSALDPTPVIDSGSIKTIDEAESIKQVSLELDCKSSYSAEQPDKALKDNSAISVETTTSLPYISNEPPPAEPASLTIFENAIDNDEKLCKTPPISEMESVSTFSSPLPATTNDMELPITEITDTLDDFELKDMEESQKSTLSINEVVVTSTFTGSFKETHIYTPPKTNDFDTKQTTASTMTSSSSPSKASPIDFDYEKAAMGVIIDETVVKKEYRDVEYNSPFTIESLNKSSATKPEIFENIAYPSNTNNILNANEVKTSVETSNGADDNDETSDDFTEFQSVPSEVAIQVAPTVISNMVSTIKEKPLEVPKVTTASHAGMILSPAILIPQAISMESQKPKIEWGDSTANINPEELARIEELFPEPKSLKSSSASNSSQRSTPTHQVASAPSISATVANKELEANLNNVDDDDDWSDFVSVTVTNNTSTNRSVSNNNILTKSPTGSPLKQRSPVIMHKMTSATYNNSNNDDEWSDFVSSAPPSAQPPSFRVPQFNSGAWQNANFYNNPLSMYHKGPLNVPTSATAAAHPTSKSLYNNNNNYNYSQQPYQIGNNMPPVVLGNNLHQLPNNAYQQQIHVMQNFSTAPITTPERLSATAATKNQFQVGSAKVAPSIALIPDLGFVAPAIPTHTSFINSLPKPSINTKK